MHHALEPSTPASARQDHNNFQQWYCLDVLDYLHAPLKNFVFDTPTKIEFCARIRKYEEGTQHEYYDRNLEPQVFASDASIRIADHTKFMR